MSSINQPAIRLVIAETGAPDEALLTQFGGYGGMMERMFSQLDEAAPRFGDVAIYRVCDGEELPPLGAHDRLLITGSPAGVYEDHAWIAPLEAAVRDALAAQIPTVGICFGHQLMAQALGGRVEKSSKGWGVGVHTYDRVLSPGTLAAGLGRFSCAVSHQDQVVELPPGAMRLAGSAFCPNGVISYADGVGLSFQMHPEFETDFGRALLKSRLDRIAPDVVALGLASYDTPSDRAQIIRWIGAHFKGAAS